MPDTHRERLLDTDGPAAPPRLNGELVFAAPWESRVFGIAVALHSQGLFEWDEFRKCLIGEIAEWERQHGDDANAQWSYYSRWLSALETLLARKGVCAPADLTAHERQLADRPAGHDHEREP